MCSGSHRDIVLGDVDAKAKALLVDVREVLLSLLGVFVCDVEIHMVFATHLHFIVDGTCHNVAWSEREARVVLLHELLAVERAEHSSVATHSLGDEERRTVAWVIKGSRVELNELHILNCSLGAIYHGNAVACSHKRIGGGAIHGTHASGSHERDAREERIDGFSLGIENVGTIAGDIGSATGHHLAEVVLGANLHSKAILKHVDVGVLLHSLDETFLYFGPGVVLVVQNAELRVTALTVEVKLAILLLVEIHAPVDEGLNLPWGFTHHLLHRHGVAEPVAGYHSVVNVLVEVINKSVGH